MPRQVLPAIALLALTAGLALAEGPATSLLPQPRPGPAAPQGQHAAPAPPPADMPRPRSRPGAQPGAQPGTAAPRPETGAPSVPGAGPARSLRPQARPENVTATLGTAQDSRPRVGTRGALCGDSAIKGTVLAPITSRVRGCGVEMPIAVEFVAGVRLNPAATLDCSTAEALKTWVKKGLQPAFAPRQVVELRIFGSYMCRPRNSQRGARISEHGSGKAVDIGGFVLDNGQTWTVLDDYNKPIRKAQAAACGIFGTTLGPGSDGYHENHLHFDTARYTYGPYCH